MSIPHLCMMTFANRSYAEGAREYLTRERYFCLPIEELVQGYHTLAFIIGASQLTIAQRQILNEFYATAIEIEPINARMEYQNYCHRLYYNDEEAMGDALGYLIEEDVDQQVMAFKEDANSAYTWRVVFCTDQEIGGVQRDRIAVNCKPLDCSWNEPVTGNISPTSIFK